MRRDRPERTSASGLTPPPLPFEPDERPPLPRAGATRRVSWTTPTPFDSAAVPAGLDVDFDEDTAIEAVPWFLREAEHARPGSGLRAARPPEASRWPSDSPPDGLDEPDFEDLFDVIARMSG